MLNFKHLRKCAIFFLVCLSLFLTAQPAVALSFSPLSSTLVPAAPSTVIEEAPTVSAGHLVSAVYRYASGGSTVIGCLENNTPVTVLGISKGFYKIDCYDLVGYIPQEQVSQDETGSYYVNCQKNSAHSKRLESQSAAQSLETKGQVREVALAQKGVPYVYGGTTPRGFDCSGFTQYVFRKAGIDLHRTAIDQLQDGVIVSKENLQSGDLVFFKNTTGSSRFASHVGIYIGNGQIIHAGSKGITVAQLDSSYFTSHYLCSRRIILTDLLPTVSIPIVSAVQGTAAESYWRSSNQSDG